MAMNSTPFKPASIIRFDGIDPTASDAHDLDDGYVILGWPGHRTFPYLVAKGLYRLVICRCPRSKLKV